MRLNFFEVKTIYKIAHNIFGDSTQVVLFGSRTNITKKGGDIDLYLIPSEKTINLNDKKILFLRELEVVLGEQKIDVVIAQDSNRLIEKQAMETGITLNIEVIKREKTMLECDKHLQRINEAYADMELFMPLDSKKYESLSKHEVQAIDQYLFRFFKLQDSMGEKLFKSVLRQFEENVDKLPFLDILKKIEKYCDVTFVDEWQDLRKIRNQLAHEYEDDAIAMANMINLIYGKKTVIERIYLTIKPCALI